MTFPRGGGEEEGEEKKKKKLLQRARKETRRLRPQKARKCKSDGVIHPLYPTTFHCSSAYGPSPAAESNAKLVTIHMKNTAGRIQWTHATRSGVQWALVTLHGCFKRVASEIDDELWWLERMSGSFDSAG